MSAAVARREKAIAALNAEQKWMEQCGGTLTGYIARYGSKNDPEHHGDGGEAIYAADRAKVEALEAEALAAVRTARLEVQP